ncbi:ABC transporter substrate-binding protein [Methanothrix sp.]|uniref:ABC transporter substrate-binding protein n=1 Tax=Methanothrix sp. TaxID=90426 RepID=UPI003C76765E
MNRSIRISSALLIALAACTASIAIGSDFTLNIFGNANMDDRIDQADIDLIQQIIAGPAEATMLSDANLDGIVDQSDIKQVQDLMGGRAEKISLIDGNQQNQTLKLPSKRILPLNMRHAIALAVLSGEERAVGVDSTVVERADLFPRMSQLPAVGSTREPDIERIVSLKPDLLITFTNIPSPDALDDKLPEGIAVLRFDLSRSASLREEMAVLGFLLDEPESTQKYLDWYDRYVGEIEERASLIEDKDRVRVLMERERSADTGPTARWAYASETGYTDLVDNAGGINIARGFMEGNKDLEAEFVIDKDPEVIVGLSYKGGYKSNDSEAMKAYYDEIMSFGGFANISAVRNGRVHIISGDFSIGPQLVVGAATVAKWLYPEQFRDLDPVQVHREFLSDLMNLDYDPAEKGAFTYPE